MKGAARDASTSPEELLRLAREAPEEVLRNPALPLVLLEDPAQGREILEVAKRTRAEKVIAAGLPRLEKRTRLSWAIDCAERVRALYETEYPGDERFARVLSRSRAFARGEAEAEEVLRECLTLPAVLSPKKAGEWATESVGYCGHDAI